MPREVYQQYLAQGNVFIGRTGSGTGSPPRAPRLGPGGGVRAVGWAVAAAVRQDLLEKIKALLPGPNHDELVEIGS